VRYEIIIKKIARRIHQLYNGGYNDFDDLVQIGNITALELIRKNKNHKYILRAIKRAIRGAAIKSLYQVSASKRDKVLALKVKTLEQNGVDYASIQRRLGINTFYKLAVLMQMYRIVERNISNV